MRLVSGSASGVAEAIEVTKRAAIKSGIRMFEIPGSRRAPNFRIVAGWVGASEVDQKVDHGKAPLDGVSGGRLFGQCSKPVEE